MLQLPYFWPQKCSTPAWCSVVGMSALSTKAAGHPGAGKFLAQGAEGWGKGSVPHRLYVTRPLLSPGSSCPEHHPHFAFIPPSHAFGGIKEEPVSKAPQLTLNQQKALASCTQLCPCYPYPCYPTRRLHPNHNKGFHGLWMRSASKFSLFQNNLILDLCWLVTKPVANIQWLQQ